MYTCFELCVSLINGWVEPLIVQCCARHLADAVAAHWCCKAISGRLTAALQPRSCNQLDLDQGCCQPLIKRDEASCLGITVGLSFWHGVLEHCRVERWTFSLESASAYWLATASALTLWTRYPTIAGWINIDLTCNPAVVGWTHKLISRWDAIALSTMVCPSMRPLSVDLH